MAFLACHLSVIPGSLFGSERLRNEINNNCRRDRAKAVDILVKDLKVFAAFNEELFKEITQLLTLENFRYEETYLRFVSVDTWFLNFL